MATIIFNGKTYNSIEEMPPEARQAYEQVAGMLVDKNGNGIPDFLEGDIVKNIMTAYTSSININGKNYNGLDDMPEDMRQRVQGAFEKMNQLGVATDRKGEILAERQSLEIEGDHQFTSKPYMPQGNSSTIQDGNKPSILQWILLGAVLFFCLMIAAVGVFFFLSQ